MSGQVHIQTLFDQLRLEHLLAYLPANGWQGAAEIRADRLRFELPNGDTPYVVLLPRSNQSPQCERLLRGAIYTLCDVLDSQPAQVIHQVLAMDIPVQVPATSGAKVKLRLSNSDPVRPIALGISTRSLESILMPGEALEIMADSVEEAICQISIRTVGG